MTESDRRESERGKYALGAQFIASPDGPMFVYAIDANNVIGPRRATNSDKREHADLWAAFEVTQEVAGNTFFSSNPAIADDLMARIKGDNGGTQGSDPFDHDHNGKPGGSLPKAKREYHRKA